MSNIDSFVRDSDTFGGKLQRIAIFNIKNGSMMNTQQVLFQDGDSNRMVSLAQKVTNNSKVLNFIKENSGGRNLTLRFTKSYNEAIIQNKEGQPFFKTSIRWNGDSTSTSTYQVRQKNSNMYSNIVSIFSHLKTVSHSNVSIDMTYDKDVIDSTEGKYGVFKSIIKLINALEVKMGSQMNRNQYLANVRRLFMSFKSNSDIPSTIEFYPVGVIIVTSKKRNEYKSY